jgi:hypothetical protein
MSAPHGDGNMGKGKLALDTIVARAEATEGVGVEEAVRTRSVELFTFPQLLDGGDQRHRNRAWDEKKGLVLVTVD